MIINSRIFLFVLQTTCTFLAVTLLCISLIRPDWLGVPWYFRMLAFAPSILFGVIAIKLCDEDTKQKLRSHFASRSALSEEEFGKAYFSPDKAQVAAKLRKMLVPHVAIDISQMNPTDRFIEDLRMDDFDSLSTVNFVIEIEREFAIKIPDNVAEKMTTFKKVVDYVAEAVKTKTA